MKINFRVWCKNKNEWEQDFPVLTFDGRLMDLKHHIELNQENHIIMQYTGLKDKNGKKIFEGDIIRYTVNFTDTIGIVKWGNKRGGFVVKHQFIEYPTKSLKTKYYSIPSNCKVIGNIYDNFKLIMEAEK